MSSPSTSAKAIAVLLCGILGYAVLPLVLGVVAWVMGNDALKDIDNGTLPESDRSMVQIGRVLGIVNVFLCLTVGLCVVGAVLLPVVALGLDHR